METEPCRHQIVREVLDLEPEHERLRRQLKRLTRAIGPRPGRRLMLVFEHQSILAALADAPVAPPAMAVHGMTRLPRRRLDDLAAAKEKPAVADAAAIGHERKARHRFGIAHR